MHLPWQPISICTSMRISAFGGDFLPWIEFFGPQSVGQRFSAGCDKIGGGDSLDEDQIISSPKGVVPRVDAQRDLTWFSLS